MREREYDVVTLFDTCVDLVLELGDARIEFDQQETLIPSARLHLGGSAAIFAGQCAKLGLRATGAGVVGEDILGRVVRGELARHGVDCGHLSVSPRVRTAVGTALNRGADRTILTFDESIAAATVDLLGDDLLRRARHLHIASYYLLRGCRDGFPALLARAKALGLSTSLDTNWDPAGEWALPDDVLSRVDILLPNENEALLLAGCDTLDEASEKLCRYGTTLVVKCGAAGARLYREGAVLHSRPPETRVVDTVGAGDSFDAGFLYAHLGGLSPQACLDCGNYCGAMSVRESGGLAAQVTREQLPDVWHVAGQ